MSTLSERDWHQIRAALIFWKATIASSQVHPMRHRAVRHLFEGDNYTPLTEDELDKLIYLDLVVPTCTIREAIAGTGFKEAYVRDWCSKSGVRSVTRRGRYGKYRVRELHRVIKELEKRREEKAASRDRPT